MSRLIAILAGLVLIVIAAILIVPMLIPMETYKNQVVNVVKEQTGRDLRIDGDIGLSFFPNIAVSIGDVGFSNASWAKEEEMAAMQEMRASLKLMPLFSGNVNTVFSVWHQDDSGLFAAIGELSGYGIDSFEARNGLVIAPSRGNAVTHYQAASRIGASGLEPVYEIEINYEQRTCQLTYSTGLAAAGLDAATLIADCEARDWEN